jgi:hypothetical protein
MILSTFPILPKDSISHILAFILLFLSSLEPTYAADHLILGDWVLNESLSDNVKKKLKGQFRRTLPASKFNRPISGGRDGRTPADEAHEGYWKTLNEGKERKAAKDIKRVGTAYPLITAKILNITQDRKDYIFLYDQLLPREIKPSASGRIYSAKGEELVEDSLGHTLSYWKESTLILETTNTMGGTYLEEIRLQSANELRYIIKLDLRLLQEPITISRTFNRQQ